jgi:hypothetical protein
MILLVFSSLFLLVSEAIKALYYYVLTYLKNKFLHVFYFILGNVIFDVIDFIYGMIMIFII